MASIGEKIRTARQVNGFTQSQLASKVGCSLNTISRWENDKFEPSPKDMEKLSEILDLDFNSKAEISSHIVNKELEDIRLELVATRKHSRNIVFVLSSIAFALIIISGFLSYSLGKRQSSTKDAHLAVHNDEYTLMYSNATISYSMNLSGRDDDDAYSFFQGNAIWKGKTINHWPSGAKIYYAPFLEDGTQCGSFVGLTEGGSSGSIQYWSGMGYRTHYKIGTYTSTSAVNTIVEFYE